MQNQIFIFYINIHNFEVGRVEQIYIHRYTIDKQQLRANTRGNEFYANQIFVFLRNIQNKTLNWVVLNRSTLSHPKGF